MATVLYCECGAGYRLEINEDTVFPCQKCERLIFFIASPTQPIVPIRPVLTTQRTYRSAKKEKPLFESAFVDSKQTYFTNRLVPILGVVALVIGLALTYFNIRPQSVKQANSADMPSPFLASASTTPNISSIANANNQNNKSAKNSSTSQNNSKAANSQTEMGNTSLANNSTVTASPSPTPLVERLANGANIIRPQGAGGRGVVRVLNGTSSDAIAKLVDYSTGKTHRLMYIRSNSNASIRNIAVGNYTLKFSLGSGYDSNSGNFLYSKSFSKFDDILTFEELRTQGRFQWGEFEVTLNPVAYGNAQTSSISATDFEDK
ncbi:MAG TPA: hypothetical protein VF644_06560 [Pyrinomonadaceae bacterium]|jgi:hypothetical protein